MSGIKLVLSGPETVTLSNQTVRKLVAAGNGDAALLYLYILSAPGQATPDDAAVAMRKDITAIEAAMLTLSRLGLVCYSESAVPSGDVFISDAYSEVCTDAYIDTCAAANNNRISRDNYNSYNTHSSHDTHDSRGTYITNNTHDSNNTRGSHIADISASYALLSDSIISDPFTSDPVISADPTADAPLPPAQRELEDGTARLKRGLEAGNPFSLLVNETQQSLGRLLSPDDLERLFGIFDVLSLPPEVILLLITHCISESHARRGRMPSMRYIEKAAYTWEREELFTLDKAESYLMKLESLKSTRGRIKRALQIKDRELTASELRYVDEWINMGFNADAVEIAYDRTVMQIGNPARAYIDSILSSWHNNNLHTPEEILAKDTKPEYNKKPRNTKDPQKKFGVQDAEDVERMQRLLEKIKSGD